MVSQTICLMEVKLYPNIMIRVGPTINDLLFRCVHTEIGEKTFPRLRASPPAPRGESRNEFFWPISVFTLSHSLSHLKPDTNYTRRSEAPMTNDDGIALFAHSILL